MGHPVGGLFAHCVDKCWICPGRDLPGNEEAGIEGGRRTAHTLRAGTEVKVHSDSIWLQKVVNLLLGTYWSSWDLHQWRLDSVSS